MWAYLQIFFSGFSITPFCERATRPPGHADQLHGRNRPTRKFLASFAKQLPSRPTHSAPISTIKTMTNHRNHRVLLQLHKAQWYIWSIHRIQCLLSHSKLPTSWIHSFMCILRVCIGQTIIPERIRKPEKLYREKFRECVVRKGYSNSISPLIEILCCLSVHITREFSVDPMASRNQERLFCLVQSYFFGNPSWYKIQASACL